MNDTLKVAGRIGAELGAAKAENDRLRGLLREAAKFIDTGDMRGLNMIEVHAALSQQAEPVEPDCDRSACGDFSPGPCDNPGCSARRDKPAPAQDEQQPEQSKPANKLRALAEIWDQNADEADEFGNAQAAEALRLAAFELRATLSAPLGKFRMGDLVKKSTGSEWVGRVVGWSSTEQTKEGYAVESSAHRNSVQIYPAKALEPVPMDAKEESL